jgi:hypothetical protein
MNDLELDTDDLMFKVEHTAAGWATGGEGIVPISPTRLEEG